MNSNYSVFSWVPHIVQDIWAAMLEDGEWRQAFFAKNQTLMAQNYAIVVEFFQERGINLYPM